MSKVIEDYQCTCGSVEEDNSEHGMACALWDDPEFASGNAVWDADHEELIYLSADMSFHEALEEVMSSADLDAPEDSPDDDKQWEPPAEPTVYQTFEEACQAKEEAILEEWVEGDVPKNYTMDGVSRVWAPDIGAWETKAQKCHCAEPDSGKNLCLHCQVWRPGAENVKPGKSAYGMKEWRPLFIGESEVLCTCDPPMVWQCSKCEVKRAKENEPWAVHVGKSTGGTVTTYVSCRHPGRPLVYPDGLTLYGSSNIGTVPKGFKPDFGVYLDKCWTAKTLALQIPWPDMNVPALDDEHILALVDLIGRMMGKGQVVEVGCIGGHGRTGTLLAIVGLEHGIATPKEAIAYVRKEYCDKAIETAVQEWYVEKYFAITRELEIPEKPKPVTYTSNGSLTPKNANKGKTTKKKCDLQGIWYCGMCAKDAWDQDDKCYWCAADFSNPGVQPISEWHKTYVERNETDVKTRIAKATLLQAEQGKGTTKLKIVTGGLAKLERDDEAIEAALDRLDSKGPHVQSRLPFDPGQERLTQPIGTLTTFEKKGRTYIPTDFTCERCEKRLYYKVRWTDPKNPTTGLPYRQELVHADDLTKITRCKGGKR